MRMEERMLKLGRTQGVLIQPLADAVGEEMDVSLVIVQARNLLERLAAGTKKSFAALLLDFLQGFQAVSGEGGADDEEFFYSLPGQLRQHLVGEGREPGLARQPGLEGNRVHGGGEAGTGGEGSRRGQHLGLVAGRVRRRAGGATVRDDGAVRAGGIRLP